MSEDSGNNETRTHGSGQAVTVVVSSGSVKWIVVGLIALIGVILLTNKTSTSAELKANQAVKTSEDTATDFAMMQLWAQRATVACEKSGVSMPSIPASLKN